MQLKLKSKWGFFIIGKDVNRVIHMQNGIGIILIVRLVFVKVLFGAVVVRKAQQFIPH